MRYSNARIPQSHRDQANLIRGRKHIQPGHVSYLFQIIAMLPGPTERKLMQAADTLNPLLPNAEGEPTKSHPLPNQLQQV